MSGMQPFRRVALSLFVSFFVLFNAGCGGGSDSEADTGTDTDTGTDNEKPTAQIVFPPMDSIFPGDKLNVRGTAADDGSVAGVTVNGVAASSSDGFATWTVELPLSMGANALVVSVEDNDGETSDNAASVSVTGVPPILGGPTGIKIDTANNRALVLDSAYDALFSVDLDSGERTLISSAMKGNGPEFRTPLNLDINADATTAYVADASLPGIVKVDIATGNRTVISSNTMGTGPTFGVIRDVALDEDGGRLFVASPGTDGWALIAVDLVTGDRAQVYFEYTVGMGYDVISYPMAIEWDPYYSTAVIAGLFGNIVTIDTRTRVRTTHTDAAMREAHGTIFDIAVDQTHDSSIFVLGQGGRAVLTTLLLWGETRVLSDDTQGEGRALNTGNPIAFRNNRLLVGDLHAGAIISVEADGNRVALTSLDDMRVGSGPAIGEASIALFTESTGAALVWDRSNDGIFSIDLATGVRTAITENADLSPDALVIDEANSRVIAMKNRPLQLWEMPIGGGGFTSLDVPYSGNGHFITAALADAPRNRILYSTYDSGELRAVSLDDFNISVVSGGAVGSGVALREPAALALDIKNDRVLSAASVPFELQAVGLSDGNRSTLLANGSNANPEIIGVNAMLVKGEYAYLLDGSAGRLIRAALSNMQREVIGGNGSGSTAEFGIADGLWVNEEASLAWTVSLGADALMVLDLTSGDHVIVSR